MAKNLESVLKGPRNKALENILKELCNSAYYYIEDTGDYDMEEADERDFFKEALSGIKEILKDG